MQTRSISLTVFHLFFLITLFSAATTSASGQYSIIEQDDKKGLLNEKGKVIIPAIHENLGWSNGTDNVLDNVIGYQKNGKWGLLNMKNERVIDPEYFVLYPFDESNLICSRKYYGDLSPQFGMITTKGKLVLSFEYDLLEKNDDRLIVRTKERNHMLYGVIDVDGEAYIPLEYRRINPLNHKLFAVSKDLFSYQIYNKQGVLQQQESYDSIGTFQEGYAKIFKNGMVGLIDEAGNVSVKPTYKDIKIENGLISAQSFPVWKLYDDHYQLRGEYYYNEMEPFERWVYKAKTNQTEALINIGDEQLTDFKNYNFLQLKDTLISYSYRGKQGVITLKGNEVIEPIYDSIYLDNPNILLYVQTSSRQGWRLADINGNILNEDPFEEMNRLSESLFRVKKGEYWGLLKSDGAEHVLCKYDSIENAFEGRLRVHFFGENGIMDEEGNWLLLPQKQEIDLLPGDRYLIRSIYGSEVSKFEEDTLFTTDYFLYPHGEYFLEKNLDKQFSIINDKGKHVCTAFYDWISFIQEDSLFIARRDTTWTFFSKGGRMLNADDPRFETVAPMKEEFIAIKIDGKYGFVDPNGDLRIANRYDSIGSFNKGLAPVMILGKWGFLNKAEKIVIQPRYSSAVGYDHGIFVVGQDGKFGIINNTGNIIVREEYDSIEKLQSGNFKSSMDGKLGLIDEEGKIWFVDSQNHMIRTCTQTGVVNTIAGDLQRNSGFAEGIGPEARFLYPLGITTIGKMVYIVDAGNNRICTLDSNNMVTTFAGDSTAGFKDGPLSEALFSFPYDIQADQDGNLYITDVQNNRIRKIQMQ